MTRRIRRPWQRARFPNETLELDFEQKMKTVDVMDYFSDPDGDMLTYTPASSMEGYVMASGDGSSMITITAVAAGMSTITVTASDGRGGSVDQMFGVTVTDSGRTDVEEGNPRRHLRARWRASDVHACGLLQPRNDVRHRITATGLLSRLR